MAEFAADSILVLLDVTDGALASSSAAARRRRADRHARR
jgi:hypothetical protein